ncbi:MAG: hypothetical protein Q7V62_03320 [Actinomycetota bacterium]|nr:hypothetical protein [Actinomycetota bacterium]
MDVIRTYVTGAFAGVAQTPAAVEQQAELIANMEEKVRDLVAEGKGAEEALGITIAEAGDLSVLASEFPSADSMPPVPSTVEVRIALRTLLVRVGAVTVALMALSLWMAWASANAGIRKAAFLLVVATVVAAAWRAWSALTEYRLDPDAVAEVLRPTARSLVRPVALWLGACVGLAFVNNSVYYGFWAWVGWCVAFVLPVETALELLFTRLGVAAVEPVKPTVADVGGGMLPMVSGSGGAASAT